MNESSVVAYGVWRGRIRNVAGGFSRAAAQRLALSFDHIQGIFVSHRNKRCWAPSAMDSAPKLIMSSRLL